MKNPNSILLVAGLVAVLLVSPSSVVAQQSSGASVAAVSTSAVPRLVNYSGSLKDSSGKTVSGITSVTFLLYKDSQGGAPVWMETQSVTPDKTGHYTVQLGAASSSGLPPEMFMSGEARWVGVQVAGADEQPRVLLVAVPYAIKAVDAETVGGLPPSAFVLAVPETSGGISGGGVGATTSPSGAPPATKNVTTTGGTVNAIPLFTTATNIQNSAITQKGTGTTAKIGIGTATPATTLDVKGGGTIRGLFSLPSIGTATSSQGFNSQPVNLTASVFNSGTNTAIRQTFQWQAEPLGNNTGNASGSLNLLFGAGSNKPTETGLAISNAGVFTFAPGQTFPGTGTITGVAAGTALTGGGTSGNVTLNLDTTKVPLLASANVFTGNQTVNGNVSATGLVTGSAYNIGSNLFAFGSYANYNAFLGFAGNTTTTGSNNTASGIYSLYANTTGYQNTADGSDALYANTTGYQNTANGYAALISNTTGSQNTATGVNALGSNTTGGSNTASGNYALFTNTTGWGNTAGGWDALGSNTTGYNNTASGLESLLYNTNGADNTASGGGALTSNTTGSGNTAIGAGALEYNATGSNNIAIGLQAAVNLTSGDNNIYIGNGGLSTESNTIRIGTGDGVHTGFYVAGVLGTTVTSGQAVYIGYDGRLGTVNSSRRYKDDITDMGEASHGLMKLRPVTFRYKQTAPDGSKPLQYGLIAEEVAEVYPDVVAYNASGQPDSVEYHKINAMLLNEVQRQHGEIEELKAALETKAMSLEDLKTSLAELKALVQSQSGK